MSLLILGATGQVGARLAQQATGAVALDRHALDFTNARASDIEKIFATHQPTRIINAAAFTAVDAAETQTELAHAINATTPALLAQAAARHAIPFVHFSTDYVFDGVQGPYHETARTNPLSVYGKSKLAGEQAVLEAGGTVYRLQWVFDARGNNFYGTMRRLLAEKTMLSVVADQLGAPSFAGHIAAAVLRATAVPPGLYHLTAGGHTSWHGFASAIAARMGSACVVAPITTAEYPTAATRPRDTRLDSSALAALGIAMPHWTEGLNEAWHETE